MSKATESIPKAVQHISRHIEEIKTALRDEKHAIKKHSYRAEILDEMLHKAETAKDNVIEELNKILN